MTVNEFCKRIQNSESKFKSRVMVVPAHGDFSAVCMNYGGQFEVVPVSQFVHSDGFIPMAERVFERLEDKRKELKNRDKHMIVVGLDGYLSFLEQSEVRRAFNIISGYLNGAGLETVIFVFRQKWAEMMEVFTHPSIIANATYCPIGDESAISIAGKRYVLVSKDFSSRLSVCYSDLSVYLKTLEQWAAQPDEDICIAVGFNGVHKFPGVSRDVRQYFALKDLFSEYCGFKADLSDDAFKWIVKNTSGTEIDRELKAHFFPTGIHSVGDVALTRHEQIFGIDEREVFQQVLRTIAPSGSFLADVLSRVIKHPDQFFNFYLNVVDEVLNADSAMELAEERNAAVRRLGIGSMEVKAAVAALIGRTKDYPADKMIPWLQLGLEVEETEWIRRAVVGREEERDLACAQSKLLTAYRLNMGLEKYLELSEYMAEYREQKCADAISDEFVNKAFKSSVPDEVVSRMALLSEFKSDPETAVLVVDALGVEYLPFLIARCKSHRFDPKVVDCVRVNLPTSTPYNPVEKEWGTTGRYRKYDDFDHLLHESFEDHAEALAAELMRIDVQVMGEIENLLKTYRRVVLTADHGATRLAVVARRDGKSRDITEFADKIDVLDWRYAKRKKAEYLDSELVAESVGEGYVLMKGYNRFSKSGAPGFEMHGGATIEEQVVPFMVIERAIVLDNAAQDESAVVSAIGGADQISENDEFDI